MSLNDTRGAESRSFASFSSSRAWNSGGSVPVSTNEATWPTFIAAPFIVPEHVEDLLRRLHLAPLGRLAAAFLRAGEVRRLGRIGARRLAAGEPAELRGAPQAAGRDPAVVFGHAMKYRAGAVDPDQLQVSEPSSVKVLPASGMNFQS